MNINKDKAVNFCYFLQGFVEIADKGGVTEEQWQKIISALQEVIESPTQLEFDLGGELLKDLPTYCSLGETLNKLPKLDYSFQGSC